jgi:transcriptional regulator with XRE-family HTH domain
MKRSSPSRSISSSSGIGARIAQIRQQTTQTQFAATLGIHKNTLIRYEQEKRHPDSAFLVRICTQYGVDPNWLLSGQSKRSAHLIDSSRLLNDYVFLPLRYSEATELDEQESLAIKKSWIHSQLQVEPEDLKLFSVEGESMKPTLYPGDVILLNLHETIAQKGIYALQMEEILVIKRLQRLSENRIKVISDNPLYESWETNLEDPSQKLTIVGRVVFVCRKL